MRDLGLEEEEDTLDDITADWSDSDGDESTQSEIQLTIVEKELEKCKQERNEFKVKCKDLQKTIRLMKSKMKRQEELKNIKLSILQNANTDALKDKDNLVMDLREILDEECKNKDLGILISRVESLNNDKAHLHSQLLQSFQDYGCKLDKLMEEKEKSTVKGTIEEEKQQNVSKTAKDEIHQLHNEIVALQKSNEENSKKFSLNLSSKNSEIKDLTCKVSELISENQKCHSHITDLKTKLEESRKIRDSEKKIHEKAVKTHKETLTFLENEKNEVVLHGRGKGVPAF